MKKTLNKITAAVLITLSCGCAGCACNTMLPGANPPGTYTSIEHAGITYRPSAKYYPRYGYGYFQNGNFWKFDNTGVSSSTGRLY